METASQLMPIILYLVLSIFIVVGIVFLCKLINVLDKFNVILDDVNCKVKKLDNLFEVIDRGADAINSVTNKVSDVVVHSIMKIFRRKRKDDIDE